MAVQSSLVESDVKDHMEGVLGRTANQLSLTVALGSFDTAYDQVLYKLGLSDLSTITTQSLVRKVLSLATVEAWRAVVGSSVHEISHSAGAPGTGQTSRASIFSQAKQMLSYEEGRLYKEYPDLDPAYSDDVAITKIKKYSVKYIR